jgi:hypothetical protein
MTNLLRRIRESLTHRGGRQIRRNHVIEILSKLNFLNLLQCEAAIKFTGVRMRYVPDAGRRKPSGS